jgi:hypothetical protein
MPFSESDAKVTSMKADNANKKLTVSYGDKNLALDYLWVLRAVANYQTALRVRTGQAEKAKDHRAFMKSKQAEFEAWKAAKKA